MPKAILTQPSPIVTLTNSDLSVGDHVIYVRVYIGKAQRSERTGQ